MLIVYLQEGQLWNWNNEEDKTPRAESKTLQDINNGPVKNVIF